MIKQRTLYRNSEESLCRYKELFPFVTYIVNLIVKCFFLFCYSEFFCRNDQLSLQYRYTNSLLMLLILIY